MIRKRTNGYSSAFGFPDVSELQCSHSPMAESTSTVPPIMISAPINSMDWPNTPVFFLIAFRPLTILISPAAQTAARSASHTRDAMKTISDTSSTTPSATFIPSSRS